MVTKPMGEYLLKQELLIKGINEEHIAEAIEKVYEEQDQVAIASDLAKKQIKKYKNLEENKAKKRLSDFLIRRGFRCSQRSRQWEWDDHTRSVEVLVKLHKAGF